MSDFLAWLLCAFAAPLAASPAAPSALTHATGVQRELARLHGHRVTLTPSGYTIDDIAGEGKPIVGVVERRGASLYLVTPGGVGYLLAGVLARPRIAGPGYKIWALGPISGQPPEPRLTPRRLGVLAPPAPPP